MTGTGIRLDHWLSPSGWDTMRLFLIESKDAWKNSKIYTRGLACDALNFSIFATLVALGYAFAVTSGDLGTSTLHYDWGGFGYRF